MSPDSSSSDTREELMAATYRVLATRGFAGLSTQRGRDAADSDRFST